MRDPILDRSRELLDADRRDGPDRRGAHRGGRREGDWPGLVAERFRAAMTVQRLTPHRLSELAGVNDRTVRRVLDGRDMRLITVTRMAAALNLDLTDLFSKPAA